MHTVLPPDHCCETPERRFAGRAPLGARDDCDAAKWLVCLRCTGRLVVRCRSTRASRCTPCSETYRRSVMTVAGSGSLDAFLQGGTVLFVTLTAPGSDQHFMPSGDACPCTPPGGVNLHEWNATSGKRWSRFVQQLRRETGIELQYFKGVEIQKRGAIHFHGLFRIPEGHGGRHWKRMLRSIAMHHGFGHEVDAQPVPDEKVAGYVAKYAAKACDDRDSIPWCDRHTGELRHGEGRYRTWSASRSWGLSMHQVKAAQRAYAIALGGPEGGAAAAGPQAGAAGPLDHHALCSTSEQVPP